MKALCGYWFSPPLRQTVAGFALSEPWFPILTYFFNAYLVLYLEFQIPRSPNFDDPFWQTFWLSLDTCSHAAFGYTCSHTHTYIQIFFLPVSLHSKVRDRSIPRADLADYLNPPHSFSSACGMEARAACAAVFFFSFAANGQFLDCICDFYLLITVATLWHLFFSLRFFILQSHFTYIIMVLGVQHSDAQLSLLQQLI